MRSSGTIVNTYGKQKTFAPVQQPAKATAKDGAEIAAELSPC